MNMVPIFQFIFFIYFEHSRRFRHILAFDRKALALRSWLNFCCWVGGGDSLLLLFLCLHTDNNQQGACKNKVVVKNRRLILALEWEAKVDFPINALHVRCKRILYKHKTIEKPKTAPGTKGDGTNEPIFSSECFSKAPGQSIRYFKQHFQHFTNGSNTSIRSRVLIVFWL